MFFSGTPMLWAILAWARRWQASPWTGMKFRGFTMASMSLSSSAEPWPETCTSVRLL